jgi:hypothetical protein
MLEDTKGIIGHGQDHKIKWEDCSKDKNIYKSTAPLKVQGTMSKEQWKRMMKKQRRNGGREKEGKGRWYNKGENFLKKKNIQFYKMSFFEFGSPLLNYLIFNLLCTMLKPMEWVWVNSQSAQCWNSGASFGKHNDFPCDILSNKQ